ncbi:glycosyltransferase family 9 protein [bacterium]|nr:glycosyltransferase family 9 protein [bacterium]
MNILLVNLARMGDLVQSTPAIQGLKAIPGTRVSLLVTSNLTDFAKSLGADEILAFDESSLLPDLLESNGSMLRAGKAWKQWVEELRRKSFNRVVNLTHDDFSAHLVSLLEADVLGRYRAPNGEFVVRGNWMRYFFTMFHFRATNPFNLADVYRLGAGVNKGAIPVRLNPETLDFEFQSLLDSLPRPIVAIHPGANHPLRQWPATSYTSLVDALSAKGVSVVLVGGPGEIELCDVIAEGTKRRPNNLAAKTRLAQLPALLQAVDLLVTNDTGPLHVAAAVGTKTVSVFLAMARPQDTAPCADGHCILETLADTHPCPETTPCAQCSCGKTIPIEAVENAALVQLGVEEEHLPSTRGQFRLLHTCFAEDGCLDLKEIYRVGSNRLIGEPAATFRPVWQAILNDQEKGSRLDELCGSISESDAQVIEQALALASRMVARIEGLSGYNDSQTLAQLESEWFQLEHEAGDIAAFLLLYRLQRESLYVQGFDALQRQARGLLERWKVATARFVGTMDEEVMP